MGREADFTQGFLKPEETADVQALLRPPASQEWPLLALVWKEGGREERKETGIEGGRGREEGGRGKGEWERCKSRTTSNWVNYLAVMEREELSRNVSHEGWI